MHTQHNMYRKSFDPNKAFSVWPIYTGWSQSCPLIKIIKKNKKKQTQTTTGIISRLIGRNGKEEKKKKDEAKSETERGRREEERRPILLGTKAVSWKWRHLSHSALLPPLFFFPILIHSLADQMRIQVTTSVKHTDTCTLARTEHAQCTCVHVHTHKHARQLRLIGWKDKHTHTLAVL